ncbi:MAG TPA: zf-HC2 domain-containing protein [Mycobacteriales bacterium]
MNEDRRRAAPDGDHDRYELLAAGWAVHALEPAEEAEFARHLAGCDACRRTASELQATLGELAYAAPAASPPPGLLGRIHDAVSAAEGAPEAGGSAQDAARGSAQDGVRERGSAEDGARERGSPEREPETREAVPAEVVPLRPRRSVRDRAARWIAVAAVLALLVVGAWNVALQRQVHRQRQVVAEREAMLRQLVQPGRRMAALRPYGTQGPPVAYVLARDGQIDVVTAGLGENVPGRESFWLWGVWGRRQVPLGRFDVRSRSMALHTIGALPPGARDVGAFAVSVEPGTAKPTTPTRIVALGGVDT